MCFVRITATPNGAKLKKSRKTGIERLPLIMAYAIPESPCGIVIYSLTCTRNAFLCRKPTWTTRRPRNVRKARRCSDSYRSAKGCAELKMRSRITGRCGPATIADSPRFCQVCGSELIRHVMPGGKRMSRSIHLKRKFCSKHCMAIAFMRPLKDIVKYSAAHRRARRLMKSGIPCESCGSTKNVDIHHRDGDWTNNRKENLQRLCRSCHTRIHLHEGMCGV